MKKILRKLHLWLSIPAGVIIFTTCLTGAMLVFQQEILELANPQHYHVGKIRGETLPLEHMVALVNEQLTDNSVSAVQISRDPSRTYTMTLKEGFRVSAFVDPYTAEVKGYYYFQESAFFVIMRIHRWLMDGTRTWGKYAVGVSTLLFAVILLTGLFIQPRSLLRKATYKIRRGKALLYGLHNVLGIYACILLLTCALTGLMWSFDWYRNGVFAIFGAQTLQGGGHGGGRGDVKEGSPVNYAAWETVYARLVTENPDFITIRIQDGKASVKLPSHITSRANDAYTFDKHSGEVVNRVPYHASDKSAKVWGWVYSLHVGDFGGLWTKIPMFIVALIGASLPVTGYWLYFRKASAKRRCKAKGL